MAIENVCFFMAIGRLGFFNVLVENFGQPLAANENCVGFLKWSHERFLLF